MTAVRIPLYARFLLWSALNLLLIIALAYVYAPRGQTGLNLLLTQSVRERLSAIALSVADDLYNVDAAKWPEVIAQHQDIAHVRYAVRARPGPPPRRENGRVKVLIRDRGPGVPEATLNRLGEPFFRPEVARSRSTGGFGLGLAIVRRCVAACDGEVKFRNREGGGFEVELDLPAQPPYR